MGRTSSSGYNTYGYFGSSSATALVEHQEYDTHNMSELERSRMLGQILLEGLESLRSINCEPNWSVDVPSALQNIQRQKNAAAAKGVDYEAIDIPAAADGRRLMDDIATAFESGMHTS